MNNLVLFPPFTPAMDVIAQTEHQPKNIKKHKKCAKGDKSCANHQLTNSKVVP